MRTLKITQNFLKKWYNVTNLSFLRKTVKLSNGPCVGRPNFTEKKKLSGDFFLFFNTHRIVDLRRVADDATSSKMSVERLFAWPCTMWRLTVFCNKTLVDWRCGRSNDNHAISSKLLTIFEMCHVFSLPFSCHQQGGGCTLVECVSNCAAYLYLIKHGVVNLSHSRNATYGIYINGFVPNIKTCLKLWIILWKWVFNGKGRQIYG